MIKLLLEYSIKNRLIIIVTFIAITALGLFRYKQLPTDAFPDISPVMVPIFAEAHGMAPEEVERLITFPIESAMNGLPDVRLIKSTSAFGMAVIYVYFKDNVNIYFARQIVSERLASATAELPDLHEQPALGPISTGLGEVFMYYLRADDTINTDGKDMDTYLRELNDWQVKFQLQTIPGVTEILSMGGHVLQYQIACNPYALRKYNIGLEEIVSAVTNNNRNAGGQFLVLGSEEYLVRGIGLLESLDNVKQTQLKVVNGTAVRINDVAEITFGKEIRRGVVMLDGKKEVVSGIVMKLYGTNTSEVIEKLRVKIPEIQKSLPSGIEIIPYYDQSKLVENALETITSALIGGGILVIIILLLFLGNFRSALIVALSLPICALIGFICMYHLDISANLMSLGGIAIAIGMLGDGSIVMVENIYRHLSLAKQNKLNRHDAIFNAALEVARPIVFSISIIIIVFLPLFTLEGVEGKMFKPMALTITFALMGSLIVALTFAPSTSALMLHGSGEKEFFFLTLIKNLYRPCLSFALKIKWIVLAVTIGVFILSVAMIKKLGTEFIPVLDEGALQINVVMSPSISLEKGTATAMRLQQALQEFDVIEQTVAKMGRPEAGSHPHPVNSGHIQIKLKPYKEWKTYKTKNELIAAITKKLSNYPGVQMSFSQPIQNMFDELLSGTKTQLAVKVFGDEILTSKKIAEEILSKINKIKGLVDLATEQSYGQPQIQIIADRDACTRYGVSVSQILEIVELAIGGEVIDNIFVNNRRFGINLRFMEEYRNEPDVIKNIMLRSSEGYDVPLEHVAEIKEVSGPIQIAREHNQRCWTVSGNIRGRDLGSVVADIKKIVNTSVKLPSGYFVEYGGQFENQQRAMKKLSIIVPTAFVLIFFMLYMSLNSFRYALLIFLNVPLALIGGVFGLYFTREYLSVPASIGFIALFGIAVQNGLVLVSYIHQLYVENGGDAKKAVIDATLLRLRPVLMTALSTMGGLVPLMLSHGMGSEVQRPLAIVVVYGLISSTFLTLFLIPALYSWFAPKLEIEQLSTIPYKEHKGSTERL